jgi:hypothetical protein
MATRTRREIVIAGAKAAGVSTVAVRGDILLDCLGNGGNADFRKLATEAGTGPVLMVGNELAAALEGSAPKPATPKPATDFKSVADKTLSDGGKK